MTSWRGTSHPLGSTAYFLTFKSKPFQKMCCAGLAWFFADERMTNTAVPALGVGWSVRLVRDRGGLARWVFGAISTCIGNHDSGSLFFQ
jgi:hypothetical protein